MNRHVAVKARAREALQRFNPNHDPKDGQFSSGDGGDGGKPSSGGTFSKVSASEFVTARDTSNRPMFLSANSAQDLNDHETFVSKDGKVGYALDQHGDLQNLFNNGGPKGAGRAALIDAVLHGARTLDAFDPYLPKIYAEHGFVATGRMPFNDKYAPDGWDYAKYGRPDVVFMAYRGGDPATLKDRVGTFGKYAAGQGGQSFDDYDAAKAASRSHIVDKRLDAGRSRQHRIHLGSGGAGRLRETLDRVPQGLGTRSQPLARARAVKAAHPGAGYSASASVDDNGVIHTSSVYDAQRALFEHRPVELNQASQGSVLLDKLGETAQKMIDRGKQAPAFNLCSVTVKGSNLFCADTEGIPRVEMPGLSDPQIKGQGFAVTEGDEYASHLRATQNELNGAKVAAIAEKIANKPDYYSKPIAVSKDNYILDGHHHWAAKIGLDAKQGKLTNDTKIKTARVDVGITKLLAVVGKSRHAAVKAEALATLQKFNPNHDPKDGQFTSGDGGSGDGAGHLTIHDDLSRASNETQPVKSLDDLYTKAKQGEQDFLDQVHAAADASGGKVMLTPMQFSEPGTTLKSRTSAERKLRDELNNDPTQLRDVMRATIANDTVKDSRSAALAFIKAHGDDVLRVKDRFVSAKDGYRDILVNYRTKSGVIAELQFNTHKLIAAKEGEGHRIYEQSRKPGVPTRMRVSLEQQANALYGAAYHGSGNGNWGKK
jgi:hypothetical protein